MNFCYRIKVALFEEPESGQGNGGARCVDEDVEGAGAAIGDEGLVDLVGDRVAGGETEGQE
ncbi:hypothetical protein D3C72_2511810 [compost metagenome]